MGHLHGVFLESQTLPTLLELSSWTLGEQETSANTHIKALRLKNGDHLLFVDGKGQHLKAEVIDAKNMLFKTLELREAKRIAPTIDVFLSAPKGDDLERSLQICVELGVHNIYLFKSDHCAHTTAPKLGRLTRIAQSSCEQSLNPWLPQMHMAFEQNLTKLIAIAKAESHVIVFDEAIADTNQQIFKPKSHAQSYSIFLGPEGGWSSSERRQFAEQKVEIAGLGPIILKVPTALCVGLSVLRSSP